ncbi:MAG: DNA polymerase I [Bacteroidia bacterium]
MSEKKLFLLDAMALIYRAYFAFSKSPRVSSKGLNTSAMFGFTNTLLEVLKKENPTHIGVAFDTAAPTARHVDFAEYKAHRQEMPEDIGISIPYIKKILQGFRIPIIEMDGYEADDIIGTLAKKAEKKGFEVFMMTPDKDYGQLVSEHVFMYKPGVFGNPAEILGVDEILAKFQIKRIDQVIDMLGLMGDAADNIPGIPGVGQVTAQKLIEEYDNVENIIANADKLKGKLAEKVANGAESAKISKQLATILLDVPVEFEEGKLIIEEPDKEILKDLFDELEFKGIAKRVLGEGAAERVAAVAVGVGKNPKAKKGQQNLFGGSESGSESEGESEGGDDSPVTSNVKRQTINDIEHTYILTDTKEKRADLISKLEEQKEFCFDTETTGIDANTAELVGLSFSFKKHEAYYIPFPANYDEAHALIGEFKSIFENEHIAKVGQNLKYDIIMLHWYDVHVHGKLFDTMLAHYLIEPDQRHNMDFLAETYLHYEPIPIEKLIGEKKGGQLSMRTVAIDQITDYAAEDADVTYQLKHILEPLLHKNNVFKLFDEVEVPLMSVLVKMETEGVRIDPQFLNALSSELLKDIISVESKIYEACGLRFNIASPKQLGDVLFEHLKIDEKAKKTKTGQYATGEDVLSKIEDKHPAIKLVLDYRELVKLKNTYVDTLPQMINPRTGRVHTSFVQTIAATGRLSSNNPNLQNIPIRTERGREIRKAFIARNDKFTLLSADYSQIELRIIAHFSEDASMIEAFKNHIDIHTATASKVYNVAIEEVNSTMRRNAKMVNFGIIYGISAFGLSQRLNIPRKEAAEIIDNYFLQYPTIKTYMDSSINNAREHGYVETLLGRRRLLRDINSANATVRGFAERNAINAPIQGSAADLIKVAMIHIDEAFTKEKLNTKMTLQVHDELVFDVPNDELEIVKPIIKQKMEGAIKLKVPVDVEIGTGRNWLEAH